MFKPIKCEHETNGLSTDIQIDDHYPLTEKQIRELLKEALNRDNPSTQQVRLVQALPGIKCPREVGNEKENRLNHLFINGFDSKSFEFVIDEIICLCNAGLKGMKC